MCGADAQPIIIKDTTAAAFEALLHFTYADALEVDDKVLVDVLRCDLRPHLPMELLPITLRGLMYAPLIAYLHTAYSLMKCMCLTQPAVCCV